MVRTLFLLALSLPLVAQPIKPIPPLPTTELKAEERAELQKGLDQLARSIDTLKRDLIAKPDLLARLPDVQIFYNAVRYPLVYHEQIDFKPAQQALREGLDRAKSLYNGQKPWTLTSGPRGYLSKIDGSVQPYVLLIPASYKPTTTHKYRLDFVEHGRNENLTELKMIQTKSDHAIGGSTEKFVVLLYGRYCNANKFAGEIDLLEAFDNVKKRYPIDEDRVLNIGFSMGGAACWQFATHYTDLFAAASPGAGFAETAEFLRLTPAEIAATPWYEKKLWHWYDCTDYAANLFNLPVVAYSGELDAQKQSADVMEKAMAAQGLKLEQIIGPMTKHAYEKQAKAKLDKRLDELVEKGRDLFPREVRLVTYCDRYSRMKWIQVGLAKQWERAEVDARIENDHINVKTRNVRTLLIEFPLKSGLVKDPKKVVLTIDGQVMQSIAEPAPGTDNWIYIAKKKNENWSFLFIDSGPREPIRKTWGSQGPIDDAFMDSFIIVSPAGRAANPKIAAWTASECDHAIEHWRKQFRGEARVKLDTEITPDDIQENNLILFGDPSSNKLIAKVAPSLPIHWTAKQITRGPLTFPADHHALIAIYPNPLNFGAHYVVLNSGFTFREYDYLNNARQIPKLPDYAVIDVNIPADALHPGGVVDAGFFGEKWELLPDEGRN